jgi:Flp pilus assembly pilin Flp
MRRATQISKDHPESGRLEFTLIVAAIILATVATYLAMSKKLATVFIDVVTTFGLIN